MKKHIDDYLATWDLYGVIKVVHWGNVLFQKATGYSSLEFGRENDMSTCFPLASVTKQFTAFAIMILYERQLLDIDKPANQYLPEELRINGKITVHNLLSHTSGLYRFYNYEDGFVDDYNRSLYSREDYFNRFINRESERRPNETFDYNNANYNLLAWIIEHVSGMAYEEFLAENIFIPLDMDCTAIDDGSRIIPDRACTYLMDYDCYIRSPYVNLKFHIGAGGLVSHVGDLYKWYQCLRDRKILSEDGYNRFLAENRNHYCYGLEHQSIYGTDRFSHGGSRFGVSSYIQNFLEEDLCIMILANNECIDHIKLGDMITRILHGEDVDPPARHKEMKVDDDFISRYAGTYLENKLKIEHSKGKWYFGQFKGNLHTELYPVGEGKYVFFGYGKKE